MLFSRHFRGRHPLRTARISRRLRKQRHWITLPSSLANLQPGLPVLLSRCPLPVSTAYLFQGLEAGRITKNIPRTPKSDGRVKHNFRNYAKNISIASPPYLQPRRLCIRPCSWMFCNFFFAQPQLSSDLGVDWEAWAGLDYIREACYPWVKFLVTILSSSLDRVIFSTLGFFLASPFLSFFDVTVSHDIWFQRLFLFAKSFL